MSEILHTLILERSGPKPVAEIGRILAAATGIHPTDAALRVRYGGGLIADGVPLEVTERLARDLEAIGVRTRTIDADLWGLASPGYLVTGLQLEEDALVARLQTGARLDVPRERVRAMDIHGLEPETVLPDPKEKRREERGSRGRSAAPAAHLLDRAALFDGVEKAGGSGRNAAGLSPRARTLLERLGELEWSGVDLCLTLFCAEPTGPLRVRKDRFDYSCLGELKLRHSLDNFLILAEEILEAFPSVWNREIAEDFLRTLDPTLVVRSKEEEVQNFHRWIVQWIRIDDEERSAKGEAT